VSTGTTIAITVALVLLAGLTAGFWLNLLLWVPMLLIGQMQDEAQALVIVSTLAVVVAAVTVLLFGLLVLDLPWPAAAIAGLLVGLTSYARPS
jgi:hypothetical protein